MHKLRNKKDYYFTLDNINEILITYTGRDTKSNNFQNNLNKTHVSIKFDHEKSTNSITFLRHSSTQWQALATTNNITHKTDQHTQQSPLQIFSPQTTQSQTSRLTNNLIKNNLHWRQRIKKTNKLNQQFSPRGYPHTIIDNKINKTI